MSDELKPCAHIRLNDEVYVHGYVDEIRRDTVIIRNEGGYFGTVLHEVMPDVANTRANDNLTAESVVSDKHVDANDGSMAQADSRSKLEADVYNGFSNVNVPEQVRDILRSRVHGWLERQALITADEANRTYCVGCEACRAAQKRRLAELQDQVDSLTAERDELRSIIDHMPKTEAECEACQEAHDRLMFNAKMHQDELRDECRELKEAMNRAAGNWAKKDAELRVMTTAFNSVNDKLAEKQHVCDVQRDSFAKMEREYRELQDVCGELERTVENLRGD